MSSYHETQKNKPYKVNVSASFLIASIFASCALALFVGRFARMYMLPQQEAEGQCSAPNTETPLPQLVVKNGENIPKGKYTAKHFHSTMSAAHSAWLTASRDDTKDDATLVMEHEDSASDDEKQQPMAEHLMVDIKHVDGAFLNSEGRLANAIIQVMNEANLTLLSYHCHGLTPMGVSCVGVLKQNYISFHTWPEEGVITLDLCVGDAKSLLPVLPILENAFGVPRSTGEKPEMRWTHKIRGFPTDERAFQKTLAGQRQRWYIS